MIETDEAIRARIDAEWLDRGREIVARERDLNRSRDSLAWEMGDWANSLERSHGDWPKLAAELEMPVGTLKNRASVARRIDPSRRRDGLTWSHHAEVAGLEPDEADAVLAETALYTWSVEHLRGVLHERGATRRAQREVERLQAQLATLQAASTTVDEAKRVVDNVRVEFEAGCRMVEEGYRRMLVAVEREDLAVASRALHGNARRGLGAGISAIGDRMVDRINNTVVRISKVLDDLSGTGTVQTDTIRHDAGTPDNAAIAPDGAPPGIRTGSGP